MNGLQLTARWRSARDSFWFVPLLLTLAGCGLSVLTVQIDEQRDIDGAWFFGGGHEGARTLLSALAGSMITVASLVFSITIVPLTLASQQYGPRLLRNFIRDTGNQVVLGTFLATFMFCLLTLRSVRGGDGIESEFVPELSITVAIVLAGASIGVLIWFIDHVANSLRVSTLVARVGGEFDAAVRAAFPDQPPDSPEIPGPAAISSPVVASKSGYVAAIDYPALVELAAAHDAVIRIAHRPGHWIAHGDALAFIDQAEPDDEACNAMRGAFVLTPDRTHEQDVEFPAEQLTEIAVRALSPGLNDPFTAITCIDRLSAGLAIAVERHEPARVLPDASGRARVVRAITTTGGLIDAVINPLRQYGCSHVAVAIRLLEALADIAPRARDEAVGSALLRHAERIERCALDQASDAEDRDAIRERYRWLLDGWTARDTTVSTAITTEGART